MTRRNTAGGGSGEGGNGEDGGRGICRSCRMWRWGLVLTLAALAGLWVVGG